MVQLTMSNPHHKGPGLNPNEDIFTIHFLCQITSPKVNECTKTCLAAVLAEEYFFRSRYD